MGNKGNSWWGFLNLKVGLGRLMLGVFFLNSRWNKVDALLFHKATLVLYFALHKYSEIKCYVALSVSPGTVVMLVAR